MIGDRRSAEADEDRSLLRAAAAADAAVRGLTEGAFNAA